MSDEENQIDASCVEVRAELLELAKVLARHVHETSVHKRLDESWTFGSKCDDGRREHPCLILYAELPDTQKEIDRQIALAILKAMVALGITGDELRW
jgi:hypothetical protein